MGMDRPEAPEPTPFDSTQFQRIKNRVEMDIIGGPDDGMLTLPLWADVPQAPAAPDAIAGRCLIEGAPWDDHVALMMSGVGQFQCHGVLPPGYATP